MQASDCIYGQYQNVDVASDIVGRLNPAKNSTSVAIQSRHEDEDEEPGGIHAKADDDTKVDAIANPAVGGEDFIVEQKN